MTPSSIMASTVSARTPLRKATPAALQAEKTRCRAVRISVDSSSPGSFVERKEKTHVAGSPLGESDARHLHARLGVDQSVAVFDLEAQEDLPLGIQRPGVRDLKITVHFDTPDLAGETLASAASQTLAEASSHALPVKGIAGGLHQDLDRPGRSGVAEQDPMDPGGQDLLHHPVVRLHGGLVDPAHRQGADDGRRPVPAGGGTAVRQTLHELPEQSHVVGSMLHLVVDVVGPGPGQLPALFVAAMGSRVVDGLTLAPVARWPC